MANLLFYKKPVALNTVLHKAVKIAPLNDNYQFSAKTNSVVLAGVEFSEAAKEYPIVFAKRPDAQVIAVALLGLRNAQNLYLEADGRWQARYIPAYVRRYPFVLAEIESSDQRTVCIDEDYAGYNDPQGEALFDENGQQRPILKKALEFLSEYQAQFQRTEKFVKTLEELELLESFNARVELNNGQSFALAGLMVVDEKKLLKLPQEKAMSLFSAGELGWIYAHLLSLSNLKYLVERIGYHGLTDPQGGKENGQADSMTSLSSDMDQADSLDNVH